MQPTIVELRFCLPGRVVTPFLNVVVCVCFIIFCTLSSSVNVWTQALLETRNLGSF